MALLLGITYDQTIWPRLKLSDMKNYFVNSKLEVINFSGKDGNSGAIQSLSDLKYYTSLKEVSFDKVRFNSIGDLTGLSSLKKVTITNTTLSDIGKLNTAVNIQEINFENNSIGDLSGLRNLHLTFINLNTNSIGNEALNSIYGQVNNVEVLNEFKENFTGENASNINNIDIRNNKFTDLSELDWISLK